MSTKGKTTKLKHCLHAGGDNRLHDSYFVISLVLLSCGKNLMEWTSESLCLGSQRHGQYTSYCGAQWGSG